MQDDLLQLAAIPSISALPEHQADVLRASQWLIERLTRAGLEVVCPGQELLIDHISAVMKEACLEELLCRCGPG